MDVRLPDGTIIRNVPEGTTRAQLTERLKRNGYDVSLLEEAPPERTIGGYAKEALKGLIPGAAGLAETAITGAAALLPEEAEQAVRERVSGVVEPIRETFAAAPGYEDTAVRKLSEAVGSTLPFLPLGALGAAGRAAAVGLGVGAGAGESRQRAEQEGATEEERGLATALGTVPGALEAYAPIRILRRLGFGDEAVKEVAGFVPALRRAAQAGGEEGLMEASSQVLQNLIAKGVYAPDEAVLGGVGEAAALGGGAGAIVSAIADLALGRRLRGRGAEEPPAEEPTTTEEPPVQPEAVAPAEEEIKALPAPRTAGYKVDREGNVVPMTEAEAEEGARLSSQFRALGLGEAEAIANRMRDQREKQFLEGSDEALRRAVLEDVDIESFYPCGTSTVFTAVLQFSNAHALPKFRIKLTNLLGLVLKLKNVLVLLLFKLASSSTLATRHLILVLPKIRHLSVEFALRLTEFFLSSTVLLHTADRTFRQ